MPEAQGPKTVKGGQIDPNYVSRLLLDCVAGKGGGKNLVFVDFDCLMINVIKLITNLIFRCQKFSKFRQDC